MFFFAVQGMDKIAAIRKKREDKFVLDRMKAHKKLKLQRAKVIVRKHHSVLVAASAGFKVGKIEKIHF